MKDFLIHVRTLEERTPAEYYGVRLAAAFGTAVSGVYVCPSPMNVAPPYGPEVMGMLMQEVRDQERRALRAGPSFLTWVASMEATPGEWLVAEGNTAAALAQASTRHDLLVLDYAKDSKRDSVSDLPDLILKVGVACVLVPHRGVHYQSIDRVALGWNGSPEAMRAMHAALPFMQGKQVLLLRGEERESHHGVVWQTPLDITAYLQRHGVTVEERVMAASHDGAGAALLEEAAKFRADLLVMGAYGRSRFSEWMLGGATRDVLAWAELPLLLRH